MAMIEYPGRKFGDITGFDEALDFLKEAIDAGMAVKALHIGALSELADVKVKARLEDRVEALEMRLDKTYPRPTFLHLPSQDEVTVVEESKVEG